jgi:hypothetical protein
LTARRIRNGRPGPLGILHQAHGLPPVLEQTADGRQLMGMVNRLFLDSALGLADPREKGRILKL